MSVNTGHKLALYSNSPVPPAQLSILDTLSIPDFPQTIAVDSAAAAHFADYLLCYSVDGWCLIKTGPKAPNPVKVDFTSAAKQHRRQFGGGELIVKAMGQKSIKNSQADNSDFHILDATAGLGSDSFVLASRGFRVSLVERSAVAALLLSSGLEQLAAAEEPSIQSIADSMQLLHRDSVDYLSHLASLAENSLERPDIVYLDPMFPASKKSALVKKEMQFFQQLVGKDDDSDKLLAVALAAARYRVVVKRPLKAPALADQAATFCLKGKAVRFDIYALKTLV